MLAVVKIKWAVLHKVRPTADVGCAMAAGERRGERMGMADRAHALSYVMPSLQGYLYLDINSSNSLSFITFT